MLEINKLETENRKLQSAVNELSVLNDIATAVSSTQSLESVIDQIVFKCIRHLHVEEGTISLLGDVDDDQTFHTMIRRQDITQKRVSFRLDGQVTGWMLKNRKPLLSNNIREDDMFRFFKNDEISFNSMLCVPLMIKGQLIGYLAVFNKKNAELFTEEDQRLLSIIASQSAHVIENARLYEEEKILTTLREEMRMAREIQRNLLPKEIPQIDGYEFSATTISAQEVGGDYYDFMYLDNGWLGFCVGDITGKGMPAAMLMANLQAALRSQALTGNNCAGCLKNVNKLLFRSTESTKFATLFYGALDPFTNTIMYTNGGHDNPILLKKDKEPVMLEATGLLLGIMEDVVYGQSTLEMGSGDILVLYTDGITESMNDKREELGFDAVLSSVKKYRNDSANVIQDKLIAEIRQHAKGVPQSDDITLMIIKKT
ncbi:MAG TPA: GAF domain-containing SpoIIE family protein phosphatase [Balneolales bacterium]|nr:GAF domain-containing SpoIIE family protein phosphatase [Balneolales bacterium]